MQNMFIFLFLHVFVNVLRLKENKPYESKYESYVFLLTHQPNDVSNKRFEFHGVRYLEKKTKKNQTLLLWQLKKKAELYKTKLKPKPSRIPEISAISLRLAVRFRLGKL